MRVAVGAGEHVRRLHVHRVGMPLRPRPRAPCGSKHALRRAGELPAERRVHAAGLRHHRGKVERGGAALLHHVARRAVLVGHHEAGEFQRGQLVIDAAVLGVLHRQQPLQVPPRLVEDIRRAVAAFGNTESLRREHFRELFVRVQQLMRGHGRIDHVLVVVARVVPAPGRRDHRARGPLHRRGGGVHQHDVIGVTFGARVDVCVLRVQRRAGAIEVEVLERGGDQRVIGVVGDDERVGRRQPIDAHPVAARCAQRGKIGDAYPLLGPASSPPPGQAFR